MTTEPTARILRFEVPVDDQWHLLAVPRGTIGQPSVLHVFCRNERVVEFWSRESNHGEVVAFRVFGIGQPTPAAARYEGTAVAPGGRLVWRLLSASTAAARLSAETED